MRNWIEIMKRINRLKYTGVIAGVGLAVVLFGSGAYANTRQDDFNSEEEREQITLDILEADASEEDTDAGDDVELSAGIGSVFEETEDEIRSGETQARRMGTDAENEATEPDEEGHQITHG